MVVTLLLAATFLILLQHGLLFSNAEFTCQNHTWLHEKICLPKDHNKLQLPEELVHISIDIRHGQVMSVNDEAETVSMKMTLMFHWKEPAFITDVNNENDGPPMATLDQSVIKQIWSPDLWIPEVVSFQELDLLNPMSALIADAKSKKIVYFTSVIINFYCHMQFDDFPFDKQECDLYMTSTNHPREEILFNSSFDFESSRKGLEAFHVEYLDIPEKDQLIKIGPATFSRAGIKIHLERRSFSFILRYFVPCFGLTVVSWVNFVIPPEAVPGRVGLLTTLFLVLTTMFIGIQVSKIDEK